VGNTNMHIPGGGKWNIISYSSEDIPIPFIGIGSRI